ncbi:B3/B4 domain-containing protein [Labilibacter marinus]|uniref:B3/B4 domain-containing protein n=1 Tax=Labilibacter marinus TaxID=1477105 RepID=UPI000832BBBD|nr:phenylalanine--tRNA ligase beta subunit-related protein [Labilibacter marinus]
MATISIASEIKKVLPQIKLGCIEASVSIEPSSDELNQWMNKQLEQIQVALTPETIRQTSTVKATKDAYRALGKDPNRYRPAAESLMRRIANGKGLYQISNAVDVLNYISIKTGLSICGYDAHLIDGDICLGIGKTDEPYEGIGRGAVNIEVLPVFRDENGAFGTPTSDSTRTMITEKTTDILYILMSFDGDSELENALNETVELLTTHSKATNINTYYI